MKSRSTVRVWVVHEKLFLGKILDIKIYYIVNPY